MVILGIILFAVAIVLWQLVPPNVIPATAPLTEFSADRAMPDLKAIAQAPHPIGSAAHAAVREYLMIQLKAISPQWSRSGTLISDASILLIFEKYSIERSHLRNVGFKCYFARAWQLRYFWANSAITSAAEPTRHLASNRRCYT